MSSSSDDGLGEVAGHGAGDDRGVALGDQEAEVSAGAEHLPDRGQGRGRVLDDFQDAVAQHEVGAVGSDQVEQLGEVSLLTGDLDPELAGAPGEGGQGVGAGVDDLDPVTELGHPDGGDAGAAADVDDVESTAINAREHRVERVPHHRSLGGGPRGAATFAR